jgi:WD40 repeat protein
MELRTEQDMIQAAGWVVIGQPFNRVEHRLGDIPDPARRRWALRLTVAVLALVPPVAYSQVAATPDATTQEPGAPARTKAATPSLPPRALLRIGTTDLRMQDPILPIAFSPDGQLVAASVAGAVDAPSRSGSIFEVRTGRRIKQLVMPGNDFFWASSLAFSPDGSKLLCGMTGGEVAIWSVADGRLLFRRGLHTRVTAVGFSPDGRFFASASADGVVRLRLVETPDDMGRDMIMPPSDRPRSTDKPAPPADREPEELGCPAFSPDGNRLVAGAEITGMMAVWRVSVGQLLRHFGPDARERLSSLAVTPDGRQILAGGSQQGAMAKLRLWDIETGRRFRDLSRAEDRGWGHAALSADGRRIAAVDFTGVRILDTATGKLRMAA